jgi:hypothetical protein
MLYQTIQPVDLFISKPTVPFSANGMLGMCPASHKPPETALIIPGFQWLRNDGQ